MPFDAGSIAGKLELDVGGFTHGMLEAEGIAKIFPQVVTEFLADPLLGVIDLAKEVGEGIFDTFNEVIDDAESMGLMAEKLGVPVEVLSSWVQFGKTVELQPQQIAQGLRMLEQAAAELADGTEKSNSKTAMAFERLGISMDFLKEHGNEPMAIFLKVKEGLDGMAVGVERTNTALAIMGGRQSDIIPLLLRSKEETDLFMESLKQMGGVTDDAEAKAAQKFTDLEVKTSIAFEGMKKAAMVPILEFLANHMKEVEPAILSGTGEITKELESLFKEMSKNNGAELVTDLQAMSHVLEDTAHIVADIVKGMEWLDDHQNILKAFDSPLGWASLVLPDDLRHPFGGSGGASGDPTPPPSLDVPGDPWGGNVDRRKSHGLPHGRLPPEDESNGQSPDEPRPENQPAIVAPALQAAGAKPATPATAPAATTPAASPVSVHVAVHLHGSSAPAAVGKRVGDEVEKRLLSLQAQQNVAASTSDN